MPDDTKTVPNVADPSITDLLRAILAVLLDARERNAQGTDIERPEIVLTNAGLTYQAIAQMLGKNPDAVRMAVSRAKKAAGETKPASIRKKVNSNGRKY